MDVISVLPNLDLLRFEIGQAYVWRDGGSVTLIDTGTPGSGAAIREHVSGSLDRIVLTHFHGDHAGSAAEIRAWSDAPVYAHRADAPMIRGEAPAPMPVLGPWEQQLFDQLPVFDQFPGGLLLGPPAAVDRELDGGEVLDFGGGAQVLWRPGHTGGSIALYLPEHRVLFTGDTIAEAQGTVLLGVFNVDPGLATKSLHALGELDAEIACFGHGDPVLHDARTRIQNAVTTRPAVP